MNKSVKIHENVLKHQVIIFENIENVVSAIAPFLLLLVYFTTIIAGLISYIVEDPECSDTNARILKKMNELNIVFVISSLVIALIIIIMYILIKIEICKFCKSNFETNEMRKYKYIRSASIILYSVFTFLCIICFIRFIFFIQLREQCKQSVIKDGIFLFISLITNIIFFVFSLSALMIITLSQVNVFVLVLFILHIAILIYNYMFGIPYCMHLYQQTQNIIQFMTEHDKAILSDEIMCNIRIWITIFMALFLSIYLINSLIEMILGIIEMKSISIIMASPIKNIKSKSLATLIYLF